MSVLTLAGRPINWAKPPKPTTRVMWSQRTSGGKTVTGSLRTIAHLDHLNTLAVKKYGAGIVVMQGPYNTTVAASAGTHDYDACLDVYIPGVAWTEQERFFRANGAGAYLREPPSFGYHIHYFTLPPREGADVSDDYRSAGFKVGVYVDGGWSTEGKRIASSQIEDYYKHLSALAGHLPDDGWFPKDISATIFNLDRYIARQRAAMEPKRAVLTAFTGNIAGARKVPVLREVLARDKPVVAMLSEAYNANEFLDTIKGYTCYQYTERLGSEGTDVAVLVRDEAKVSKRRPVKMSLPWIGPKGGAHDPRVYPSMIVEADGVKWGFLGPHFPTANNDAAQRESEKAVVEWLRTSGAPSVAAGDFNELVEQVRDFAGPTQHVAQGTKVDHALYTRCRHDRTDRLGKDQPEGMHGWILYTFSAPK